MTELLFWFLVSQTLAGLPQMPPGTEVRLVSGDLLTVYGRARVEEDVLRFAGPLAAGQDLRLLIFPADATDSQQAQVLAGAQALAGRVSEDGSDILVEFPELDGPISFRKWLMEERGIALMIPGASEEWRAP